MFVMLSVCSSTVRERKADTATEKVIHIDNILISNNNNNNIIERNIIKSLSFDKNINKSNLVLTELNNYQHQSIANLQAPVTTILNDLSPTPATIKVNNQKAYVLPSPMTPKGFQENSPDVKAMRYYRLWIYTCNAVLLMAVIVFCGVAGKILLADYKRLLVHGLNLGQPSFVYAYLALLVQSGFLQLIGCIGALRLSEKLLNAYWLLLLVLLIGDAILGIFWMFKFDKIMQGLQPMLRYRLTTEYGNSIEFSDLWDKLQNDGRCCGIVGPQDFQTSNNRSYPTSCCIPDKTSTEQISMSRRPLAAAVVFRNNDDTTFSNSLSMQSNNNISEIADTSWNHVMAKSNSPTTDETRIMTTSMCAVFYQQGCMDKIVGWLRSTADILFVLGYCVIAFLKLSFLGILRYEIKEMIQKIKLLQTEMNCSMLSPEMEAQQIPNTSANNGGVSVTEPKVGNRDRERTRVGSGESERESLLIHDATPKFVRHKNLHVNVDCKDGSNNNPSNPMIPSVPSTSRTINGNNNYELTEFDTRAPTYRKSKWPSL